MTIVSALDVHRSQITFKCVDLDTGQVNRGRVTPVTREKVRQWATRFEGQEAHVALEATTGWRFVAEELMGARVSVHLADPAETSTQRGRKRRAKTDHKDCDLMCQLLVEARLPEAWVPPAHILALRTLVRLRKTLVDERIEWQQRMQAQLFHQGVRAGIKLTTSEGRERLGTAELSPAGQSLVQVGLSVLDALDDQLRPLEATLRRFARRQRGCRVLAEELFGVGLVTSTAILAELGDARRFSSSDDTVRYAGLDVTVHDSNARRPPGYLSRQGPEVLRWALFDAAQSAARTTSPDHSYYLEVRRRIDTTGPACPWPASCADEPITYCALLAKRPWPHLRAERTWPLERSSQPCAPAHAQPDDACGLLLETFCRRGPGSRPAPSASPSPAVP